MKVTSKSILNSSCGYALVHSTGALVGALVAVVSLSCTAEVVVGDAECEDCQSADASVAVDTSAPDDTATPIDTAVPDAPDCTAADVEARAGYEAWKSTPNALAELAGTMFSGYIEGGADLTLFLERDQTATLIVGDTADPPVKDTAYLCGGDDPLETVDNCVAVYDSAPLEGGTYPLHGASFENGRLTVEVPQTAAVDPWCALQDPVLSEDCYYSLLAPATTSYSPSGCTIGGEIVDCGWFAMADQTDSCRCTSTECFATIGDGFTIDVQLMPDDGRLEGSIIFRENTRTLYLWP